jgi:putative tryptophan/tyrosine transport system substrate-binding protein
MRRRPKVRRYCEMVGMTLLLLSAGGSAVHSAAPISIGVLTEAWGPPAAMFGLLEGLKALGYRENQEFVIGVRFTHGNPTALPMAARELVELGVDILFVEEVNAAKAAREVTGQIPIVFAGVGDLLGEGLIQSFARPGGNMTGVTELELELAPKRLEVFKDLVPGLQRVMFVYNASDGYALKEAAAYRGAARHLGLVVVEKPVQTQEEAQAALAQVRKVDVDGLLAPHHGSLNIPGFVLEATARNAIPTIFSGAAFWVERGALAGYGPDYYESGRQAARLVDKILKGANPAEIPAEVNTKIQFTINLKVAQALGLTIAPEMLYRADRLIR